MAFEQYFLAPCWNKSHSKAAGANSRLKNWPKKDRTCTLPEQGFKTAGIDVDGVCTFQLDHAFVLITRLTGEHVAEEGRVEKQDHAVGFEIDTVDSDSDVTKQFAVP